MKLITPPLASMACAVLLAGTAMARVILAGTAMARAILAGAILAGTALAAEKAPKVVTSIKPVHSLVATVMRGVGAPELLIKGAGSPHTYALKPSQATALEHADLVFWIGHDLEAFLEKPIETISRPAASIELINAPGVKTLAIRDGGTFASHDHDHEADHKAGHKDHGADHKDHEDNHDRHAVDAHIWLDPVNAKALIGAIKDALVDADPARHQIYKANAVAAIKELDGLIDDVTSALAPLKDRQFVVFHDGYQYFEKRFGIAAAGAITVSPQVMPGAARVGEIRTRLKTMGATCVFSEPQFKPKLVSVVIEGTSVRAGVIDPLGADLAPGPKLYGALIRNMSTSIRDCLSKH